MRKLLSIAISLVLVLSMLTACSAKPQDFTWNGLTVTLDSSFVEHEIDQEAASYASYFKMYVVVISYETVDSLVDLGYEANMTAEDYAKLSIEVNEFDAEVKTTDGVTYYNYTGNADGTDYTYMATVHLLGNSFWLVQFAAETKDYQKAEPQFIEWAKTVTYAEATA